MQRKTSPARSSLFLGTCCFCLILLLHTPSRASGISARYTQSSGTQVTIEIDAGPEPPASVILLQRFPAGTVLLNSQPGASNYNANKGHAKWLLRGVKPGRSTVSVTLDRAVQASEISAEIRFKPQGGGGMQTVQVGK